MTYPDKIQYLCFFNDSHVTLHTFNILLAAMTALAAVVFICLHHIDAGYGKFYNDKWGPSVNNRAGWVMMEAPVFIAMILLWYFSERRYDTARLVILLIFEAHYFQRSFIFPFLIRGNGRMPVSIILLGVLFNTMNAFMQGGWLFYLSPAGRYPDRWLLDPRFISGVLLFAAGMFINIQSDSIIRHLRKPGDNSHYLPAKGLFKYVTSANYFGELLEWVGFAVLTWSYAGAVFVIWTFANLAPRASRTYDRYRQKFASEFDEKRLKRIIPFIY